MYKIKKYNKSGFKKCLTNSDLLLQYQLLRSAVLPICSRTHFLIFFKYLCKIGIVPVSYAVRYLVDRKIRLRQQLLCQPNPFYCNKFQYGHICLFFKQPHQILCAKMHLFRNLLHINILLNVL